MRRFFYLQRTDRHLVVAALLVLIVALAGVGYVGIRYH